MAISPNLPGTLAVLTGTALLLVVSLSVPIIKSVFFLKATILVSIQNFNANGDITLGTWGFCVAGSCTSPRLGYNLEADTLLNIGGVAGDALGGLPNSLIKGLTYALVIHPVAAGFGGVGSILGLLSLIREFSGTCLTTFFSSFAATFAWLAFIFDIITFSIAKSRINSSDTGDSTTVNAELGNAIWLTLTAAILLSLSGCFFGCGRCCIRQRANRNPEHEKWKPSMDPSYAANMRQDALEAEKARQNTGYVPNYGGGNGYGRGTGRNGKDLPAFAEYNTAEEVPLTAMRESMEEERVPGVGMGYGRGRGGPQQQNNGGYAPYQRPPQNQARHQNSGSSQGQVSQSNTAEPFRGMYDAPPMPPLSRNGPPPNMPTPYNGSGYAPPSTQPVIPPPPSTTSYHSNPNSYFSPQPPQTLSPPRSNTATANPYDHIAALPTSSRLGNSPSPPSNTTPLQGLAVVNPDINNEKMRDNRSSIYSGNSSHYSPPSGTPPDTTDDHQGYIAPSGSTAPFDQYAPQGYQNQQQQSQPSHPGRQGSQATTVSTEVQARSWPNPYDPTRPPPSY